LFPNSNDIIHLKDREFDPDIKIIGEKRAAVLNSQPGKPGGAKAAFEP
jgi:hypothetical protein